MTAVPHQQPPFHPQGHPPTYPPGVPPHQGYPPYPYPPQPLLAKRVGYGRSLLASLVWSGVNYVLIIAVAVAQLGPGFSPEIAGYAFGSVLIPALVGALPVWLIARRRVTGMSFWGLVALALPFFVLVRLVIAVGGR
jgi:hypothetical protein